MKKTPSKKVAAKKTVTKVAAKAKPEAKPVAPAKKPTVEAKKKVVFQFKPEVSANEVAVAGSFNDWLPVAMKANKKGVWEKSVQLAPGSYEYRFVLDGHWICDPACDELVSNPFGGHNSLLTVA